MARNVYGLECMYGLRNPLIRKWSPGEARGSGRVGGPRFRASIPSMLMVGVLALWLEGLNSQATLALDRTELSNWRRAKLVLQQVPVGVGSKAWDSARDLLVDDDLADGSRVVVLDLGKPTPSVANLTGGFVAAGQPDVSPDGTRVLFSGRVHAGAPCGIWEVGADGSGLRKVLSRDADCLEPIYLSTVYSIGGNKPALHLAFRSRSLGGNWALYICRADGTGVRRITFGPGDARDACHLLDGRIVFSQWLKADEPNQIRAPTSTLFTVFPDGTDVFPFYGQHQPPAARTMLSQADDGRVVFVEAAHGYCDGDPLVVAVSPSDSLDSRRVVADGLKGAVRAPVAASASDWLLAYRARGVSSYGLYWLSTQPKQALVEIYNDKAWHEIRVKPLRPTPPKPGSASVVKNSLDTGLVYCLDARRSSLRGDVGTAAPLRGVKVFSARQQAMPGRGDAADVLLGLFQVEQDGSFFLEVPASTPLRLETIDTNGQPMRAMTSWFWVMPNEKRGCIGCHENRYSAPSNRRVLALQERPICTGVASEESNFGCRDADGAGGMRR